MSRFREADPFEYQHSFKYLGGQLGREELKKERQQKRQKGTFELTPVPHPRREIKENVMRAIKLILDCDENHRDSFLDKIKQKKDNSLSFIWDVTCEFHEYYCWAFHCMERCVVGWEDINAENHADAKSITIGTRVCVSGLKNRSDLNGRHGVIVTCSKRQKILRHIVALEGMKGTDEHSEPLRVSTKADNIRVTTLTLKEKKELRKSQYATGVLPVGQVVFIQGLSSANGATLNGLDGSIYYFNSEKQRYMVHIFDTNCEVLLQPYNVNVRLPVGWSEILEGDCYYYTSPEGKVVWKHPGTGNGPLRVARVISANKSGFIVAKKLECEDDLQDDAMYGGVNERYDSSSDEDDQEGALEPKKRVSEDELQGIINVKEKFEHKNRKRMKLTELTIEKLKAKISVVRCELVPIHLETLLPICSAQKRILSGPRLSKGLRESYQSVRFIPRTKEKNWVIVSDKPLLSADFADYMLVACEAELLEIKLSMSQKSRLQYLDSAFDNLLEGDLDSLESYIEVLVGGLSMSDDLGLGEDSILHRR